MMHRWVEHTAEIELEIEAGSAETVFVEALEALRELLPEPKGAGRITREIELKASDLPALLAAWLEELVYLSETARFTAEGVEELNLDRFRLEASVVGGSAEPQTEVKAVTYHRLSVEKAPSGQWSARVVLDV